MKGVLLLVLIFFGLGIFSIAGDAESVGDKTLLQSEINIDQPKEEVNPYAMVKGENDEADLTFDGLINQRSEKPLVDKFDMPEKNENGHSKHQMVEVKLSEHEWVSASRKGYGLAVGITLFAGVLFGVMSLIRFIW